MITACLGRKGQPLNRTKDQGSHILTMPSGSAGGREGSGSLVSERPAASISDPEGGLSVLTVGQANQSSLSVLLGVRGW